MRLLPTLALATLACTARPAGERADSTAGASPTLPVVTAADPAASAPIGPFDTSGAKALTLIMPVCDSTAAALGREYHDPSFTRGIDFLDLGDGLAHPACRLGMHAHTGVQGAPPLPLTRGPTPVGWDEDSRFMADGIGGARYGFRGHGAVCSVDASWNEPGELSDSELAHYQWTDDLTLDVLCALDPTRTPGSAGGGVRPRTDDGREFAADLPWRGAQPLNIEGIYQCFWYSDLTVVVVPIDAETRAGVPGEDIIVRPGTHRPCGRDSLPGDFIVRAGFFNRFRGIIDSTLIVEDGDAATYSGLQLYDLHDRRRVADLRVAGMASGLGKGYIGVWMSDSIPPAAASCPAEGGIRVQRLMVVTLATGEVTPEGSRRCRYEE